MSLLTSTDKKSNHEKVKNPSKSVEAPISYVDTLKLTIIMVVVNMEPTKDT